MWYFLLNVCYLFADLIRMYSALLNRISEQCRIESQTNFVIFCSQVSLRHCTFWGALACDFCVHGSQFMWEKQVKMCYNRKRSLLALFNLFKHIILVKCICTCMIVEIERIESLYHSCALSSATFCRRNYNKNAKL